MSHKKIMMEPDKKIALVAHDKQETRPGGVGLVQPRLLAHHEVLPPGQPVRCWNASLDSKSPNYKSGPLGGDQQVGADESSTMRSNFLIFFWDPLEPMPHDPDVKALLRWPRFGNIPIACNRASADFMISSPLMDGEYNRLVPDYEQLSQTKDPASRANA